MGEQIWARLKNLPRRKMMCNSVSVFEETRRCQIVVFNIEEDTLTTSSLTRTGSFETTLHGENVVVKITAGVWDVGLHWNYTGRPKITVPSEV